MFDTMFMSQRQSERALLIWNASLRPFIHWAQSSNSDASFTRADAFTRDTKQRWQIAETLCTTIRLEDFLIYKLP